MQRRRHTCLVVLVILHSFADFIPVSIGGRNHHYQETKREENNNHHHDSLGDVAKLKSENEISRVGLFHEDADKKLTTGSSDVTDAMTVKDDEEVGDKADDKDGDRFMEGVVFRLKSTSLIDHKDRLLLQALQNHRHHRHHHHHRPSPNKYKGIKELEKLLESNQDSNFDSNEVILNHPNKKQAKDKETNQHDRQADPLLSCVEAFCSKSDWDEEEYLECISTNCMPAIEITGKRDLHFQNGLRKPTKSVLILGHRNDSDLNNESNNMSSNTLKFFKILKGDSIPRDRLENVILEIRRHNDDDIGYQMIDDSMIDGNVRRIAAGYVEDYDEEEKLKFPLKLKKLLRYSILRNKLPTDINTTINKNQQTQSHTINTDQHKQTKSYKQQQQQQDDDDDDLNQQFNKINLIPTHLSVRKVHGIPTRLRKRGFNDVYNTCVQSNCGHDGGRGLMFYSCIQSHCG